MDDPIPTPRSAAERVTRIRRAIRLLASASDDWPALLAGEPQLDQALDLLDFVLRKLTLARVEAMSVVPAPAATVPARVRVIDGVGVGVPIELAWLLDQVEGEADR